MIKAQTVVILKTVYWSVKVARRIKRLQQAIRVTHVQFNQVKKIRNPDGWNDKKSWEVELIVFSITVTSQLTQDTPRRHEVKKTLFPGQWLGTERWQLMRSDFRGMLLTSWTIHTVHNPCALREAFVPSRAIPIAFRTRIARNTFLSGICFKHLRQNGRTEK